MADTKISALTAATTPLAGTEVLPIVQSGTTVKVANNDLRPKQIQSNATSGVLQVAGPTAATTRVMTTPDANFTAARIDAAQSFTGDQTLSTGNIIQGTAAKGVNFTANTPLAGMTSQLLNWYEEGSYTASLSAGSGTYTAISQSLKYTRMGRVVNVTGYIFITTNGTAATNLQFTLPFNCADARNVSFGGRENQSSGLMFGGATISTSTVAITKYDGTYLGGAAYNFPISFSYSI